MNAASWASQDINYNAIPRFTSHSLAKGNQILILDLHKAELISRLKMKYKGIKLHKREVDKPEKNGVVMSGWNKMRGCKWKVESPYLRLLEEGGGAALP